MGLIGILATVILIATIATLIFAFTSYFASRLRQREKAPEEEEKSSAQVVSPRRVYFERYLNEEIEEIEEEKLSPTAEGDDQWE